VGTDAWCLAFDDRDLHIDGRILRVGTVAELFDGAHVDAAHAHRRATLQPLHVGERGLVVDSFGEHLFVVADQEDDDGDAQEPCQNEGTYFDLTRDSHDQTRSSLRNPTRSRAGLHPGTKSADRPSASGVQQGLYVFFDRGDAFDEVVHPRVRRGAELLYGAPTDDSTRVHHGHAVANGEGAFHVVRDHDAGDLQTL